MGTKKRLIPVVERGSCVACGTCQNVCPRGAITILRGLYAAVDPAGCVGCGMCSRECPAEVIQMEVHT